MTEEAIGDLCVGRDLDNDSLVVSFQFLLFFNRRELKRALLVQYM